MQIRTLREAPFVVDVLPFRLVADQWQLAVVCKATFEVVDGGCRTAREPVPVLAEEIYDEGGLYAPRDLVPCKAQPEIVVVRAAAGSRLKIAAANLDVPIEPPRPRGAPGGPPEGRWHVTQLASEPLGDDFDESTFQYAPPQLRLPSLVLDGPIVIEDGQGARLTIVLPNRSPVAHLESMEATSRPVQLEPDLVWIDVAERRCTVTWRGVAETELDPDHGLRVGMIDGGTTRWPSMRAPTTTAASLQASYEATHGELPTAVLDSFFGPPPQPPPSEATFAGPLPATDHHPAWLAPAGSGGAGAAPRPAEATEAPTAKRKPRPPKASSPHIGPARASAPPNQLSNGLSPPRPSTPSPPPAAPRPPLSGGAMPPPPPRRPPGRPSNAPVPAPAPIWSAEPRTAAAAPIAPNPAKALIADERESFPPRVARGRDEVVAKKPEEEPLPTRVLDVVWASEDCDSLIEHDDSLALSAAGARPPGERADDGQPVVIVLRDAEATPIEELAPKLMAALRERRGSGPIMAVVKGDLHLRFDPRVELSVYTDAARPLARTDKKLAETIARVDELLETPLAAVPEVAHGQRARVVEQWRRTNREMPRDFLDTSARDLLLQQRAFDSRDVMGEEHVRATLVGERRHGGEGQQVPVYLPAEAKKRLPLITTMPVRCLVRLMPRQDERESHPVALVVLALGRFVSLTGR